MPIEFTQARREKIKARVALWGLNGAGKSWAALTIARALGEPIYGIDTENGRMKLFADRFDFQHGDLPPGDRTPEGMRDAVRTALGAGAGTIIIDSVSHEWLACLAEADRFGQWKDVSPRHKEFFEVLCAVPAHVIVTMRANIKYDVSEDIVDGRKKQTIVALGPGPVQGKGVEYDFDVLGQVDQKTHQITFANRCDALVGQTLLVEEAIPPLLAWLESGEPDAAMQRAPADKVAELRALLVAEGQQEAVIDDAFTRTALKSGGVLTLGWVEEKIAAAHDRAKGATPAAGAGPQVARVPKTWAEIELAIGNAYSETVVPDFEAFVVDVAQHLFGKPVDKVFSGKPVGNLNRAEFATLQQKAAGACVGLLTAVEREFPPPSRAEMQAAFAAVLDGTVLDGPAWSLGPDETDRPVRFKSEPAPVEEGAPA